MEAINFHTIIYNYVFNDFKLFFVPQMICFESPFDQYVKWLPSGLIMSVKSAVINSFTSYHVSFLAIEYKSIYLQAA